MILNRNIVYDNKKNSLYNYINITPTITQLNLIKPVSLTFSLAFSPIYQIYILVSLARAIEVQNSNENCFTILY